MALSKVQIGNMALANIGTRSTIESFSEASQEAFNLNLWYDVSRKKSLEAFNWNFARKRLALAAHSEDPPEAEWGFRYQYPSDCVMARSLENPTIVNQSITRGVPVNLITPDAIPFTIETDSIGLRSILTDLDEAVLIYTFDQNNISTYSSLFVEAFSFDLASKVAIALTGKKSIKDSMMENFLFSVRTGAASDANEQISRPPRDADSIRGRW